MERLGEEIRHSGPKSYSSSFKDGYLLGSFREGWAKTSLCEFGFKHLPEFYDAPPHTHDTMSELTIVKTGACLLFIKDAEGVKKLVLKEGEWLFLEPGTICQNPRNAPHTSAYVLKFPSNEKDKRFVEVPEFERFKFDRLTFVS